MRGGLVLFHRELLNDLSDHFPALAIVAFQKRCEILGCLFIRMITHNSENSQLHIPSLDSC